MKAFTAYKTCFSRHISVTPYNWELVIALRKSPIVVWLLPSFEAMNYSRAVSKAWHGISLDAPRLPAYPTKHQRAARS